jgi:hypothetical protein
MTLTAASEFLKQKPEKKLGNRLLRHSAAKKKSKPRKFRGYTGGKFGSSISHV